MEIDARPAVVFRQIFDGQNSYSSMPGVEVPPLTKFGMSVRQLSSDSYELRFDNYYVDTSVGVSNGELRTDSNYQISIHNHQMIAAKAESAPIHS